MVGIASAATSVVIGHVAAGTRTIRVGAGGIMLPNHSPLVIAEQFGTLAVAVPRAHRSRARPRARHRSAHAARAAPRSDSSAESFPQDVLELQALSRAGRNRASSCRPCPARARVCRSGSWGRACSARSSPRRSGCRTRSPRTSRRTSSMRALAIYRAQLPAVEQLAEPYAMVGANVIVGGHGRRGAAPVHVRAASVHESVARHARTDAAAHRRHRGLLVAARKGAGVADARVLVRRLADDRARRASTRFVARHGRRRDDRRGSHLRSCRAAALVRAARVCDLAAPRCARNRHGARMNHDFRARLRRR